MKTKSPRIKIYLNGHGTQVDRFFLDVLALTHFGQKYEDDIVKKEVRKLIRQLMKDEPVHTQTIHQKILASFLPLSIQKQLEE